ncbi:type I restriction-modification system endonuclease subunit alpha [Anoxybacillus gonensis]|uniref:Type II restriction enzyme BslI subunit alpha n=1 Tax=Bacillus sp. (strain NEB-606) TaxID=114630 RepID=T2BLA_BACSQ|nr:type I restriction-modification system endonuclease subunit alpha [Anoxybacillus gonensis]Q9LAI1.1 RecName: Full=Type II restriction enzyme BslI subunit alpha; Short=R.BslIalpha; AltName: Full=Endonuclease BslI subunit alpha; AltName: Full=Type IIT restriction enzyme BslI subunit alpha; AltName: Full=Type-2 restriction enzyme BslI subunit alpha [Bacillus sp. NEB-606]AAF32530.1 BslIRalpha [Bacillus sp. NEB-606]EMI09200.1 Type-II restriction enzyme BslI subunit alpha [Anoxybacillus gonensis]
MERQLKSIAYAFVANDIDVYIPDGESNCIVVTKLVCKDCGQYWHTSLSECYFCGTLNFYLYECNSCGKKYSLTSSSKSCDTDGCNGKLIKRCSNPECISRTNEEIQRATDEQGGVFDLNSSFNVSLNHCVTCGSKENYYKTYRIYSYRTEVEPNIEALREFANNNKLNSDEDVIIIKHLVDNVIHYGYIPYSKLDETTEITTTFSRFSDLVSELFPVNVPPNVTE